MHLNNNWYRNTDTGKWSPQADKRSKTDFDSYKESFESVRFYQRCLSGSTYVGVHSSIFGATDSASMSNIYDILGYYNPVTYYHNAPLQYIEPFTSPIPDDPEAITTTASLTEYLTKVESEYNFTLKNLYSPQRLIDDQKQNLYYVDAVTTDQIKDITIQFEDLVIDGIRLREGHRVLIKDQWVKVTIPTATNPSTFFTGEYKVLKVIGADTRYLIPSSDNGVYKYTKKKLVREDDLDTYEKVSKYSICSKLGTINREKQFKLKRLTNGFFPLWNDGELYPAGPVGESIYFEDTHNFVLRNRVDYNNLYELVLYDTIKHGTQSFTVELSGGTQSPGSVTYSIPQRTIAVGEFGTLLVDQEGISNFIYTKHKVNYRSITETTRWYWICGDEGVLLRVDKRDFSITRVNLNFRSYDPKRSSSKLVITQLNSVSFFNDLKGVVVGDFNQIWITNDGGWNWEQIYLADFDGYNYNTVTYTTISKFFVGGDNGVFIEFEMDLGQWYAHKRRISKITDDGLDDEYLLVDDINSLTYVNINTARYILIGCAMSNFYVYDISGDISSLITQNHDFYYIDNFETVDNSFGDISSVIYATGSSVIFSTFNNIYTVDVFDGIVTSTISNIISATMTIISTQSGVNSLYDYGTGLEYISAGNLSLWQRTPYANTQSVTNVYGDLYQRLRPRMLFMDYDIGSKLYWFDDFSQYRLPERIQVPINYLMSDSLVATPSHIGFNRPIRNVGGYTYSETNWITYWKDRLKTFAYYTNLDNSNVVEPSFTFSSSDDLAQVFTYTQSSVTTTYTDILPLMPNAIAPGQGTSATSSRFRQIVGVPITTPSSNADLFFYDYLGIWKVSTSDNYDVPKVGDVLEISSNVFEGNFVINRVEKMNCVGTASQNSVVTFTPTTAAVSQELRVVPTSLTNGPISQPFPQIWTQNQWTQALADAVNANDVGGLGHGYEAIVDDSGVNWTLTIIAPTSTVVNLAYDVIDRFSSTTMYAFGPYQQNYCDFYCYFYTDFNENILNNVIQSNSTFDIRNLNKYSRTDSNYFIQNFNKHYISYSYDVEEVTDRYNFGLTQAATASFQFTGKYSQWSAYYNLQSKVDVQAADYWQYTETIDYRNSFLNFGYSPNYNLLGYLNYLDPNYYTPDKEFFALPNYVNVPGPDSAQPLADQIYIDTGIQDNKMYFGANLKYIWEHLYIWTFVDISLDSTETKRLLIVDKRYQASTDQYIIEFHKEMDIPGSILSVDILSRRTLKQISNDLQYINGMHRPDFLVGRSYTNTTLTGTWSNWESDIKTKYPTDSYTKVLLTDSHIVRDITGIIYIDNDSEISTQVTKLNREYELEVVSISVNGGEYQLNFSERHNLYDSDSVIISMVGTSSQYPDELLGYHNVEVINDYSIKVQVTSIGLFPDSNFLVTHIKRDPFFNYQPVDLFDMGIGDKKVKQSIKIPVENYEVDGLVYDIFDIDLNNYRYRMIDGLDLVTLTSEFHWILEAEVDNAVIGFADNGELNWYRGVWRCGRWFGGNWISGDWISGDWYSGKWSSKFITDKKLSVEIDDESNDFYNSNWYGGRWFGGLWEHGTWNTGRWYGGTWSNGRWFDGTWNNGVWETGEFKSGIWALGDWNNGVFNSDNGPSYWIDGKFNGGDFENGTWFNGTFDRKDPSVNSRFGTKAFNSRNAIWRSGKFLNGEVHSFLNLNDEGSPDVSDIHKYTKWYTGLFAAGDWYGGLSYNINFKNAVWHGGISEEIDVLRISATANTVTLDGDFEFNVGDQFYIVDNQNGYFLEPDKYTALLTSYDTEADETLVTVNAQTSINYVLPEGSWELQSIYTNVAFATGSIITPYTVNSYIPDSSNIIEQMIGSEWFIYNANLSYNQDETPVPLIVQAAQEVPATYSTYTFSSTFFGIGINTYSVLYGANNTSMTFSLTQDPILNPSGIILDFGFQVSTANLKAVSTFENSTWNSGVWYNGVFKDGVFNGGAWYNGYFDGTWG